MVKLKELRKEKGITQEFLAKKIGISRSAIAMYEGDLSEPDFTTAKLIADFFGVSVGYLIGSEDTNPTPKGVVKIPVYGTIPAGIPTEMIDNAFIEDYEEINADLISEGNDYFGLKVKGESMMPEFRNGDTLILKKQNYCESGDFCAVSINHTECTFKKVLIRENGLTLQPLNPNFEPMFFSQKEINNLPITILGIVKEVRRSY